MKEGIMKIKKACLITGASAFIASGLLGGSLFPPCPAEPLTVYAAEAAPFAAGETAPEALSPETGIIDYTVYVDQVAALAETEDQKRYRALCPAFEAGQAVTLQSSADREAFVNYYYNSYDLYSGNTSSGCWFQGDKQTYIKSAVPGTRAACITATIDKFGLSTEGDAFTIIRDTCSRVRSGLKYDQEYYYANYLDSLAAGYGICVHYSAAAYILLNAEGIPTRMVGGYRSGGGHSWNQCFVNGAWVTVDFTSFADKNISPDGFVTADYLPTFVEAYTLK